MAPIEWQEVRPGRFERYLDKIERFWWQKGTERNDIGKQSYTENVGIRIDFSTGDLFAYAKQAWTAMRYDHPIIASTVDDEKRIYEVPDTHVLEEWLKETVFETDLAEIDLIPQLKFARKPTLYVNSKLGELTIRTPHHFIDGIGTLHLINNLLGKLHIPVDTHFGDEGRNLSPLFMTAAHVPPEGPKQKQKVVKAVGEFIGAIPPLHLPVKDLRQPPSRTVRQRLRFTVEETSRIMEATKNLGWTVTVAFHIAIVLATERVGDGRGSLATFSLINLRHRCEPPYSSEQHPTGIYCTIWPIVIRPGEFTDTAERVKKYYIDTVRLFSDKAGLSIVPGYNEYMTQLVSVPPPEPWVPSPTLSSIGILDWRLKSTYGLVKVKDFWITLDITDADLAIHLWTFQERLQISISYNEAYYTEDTLKLFLQTIKSVLFEALAL